MEEEWLSARISARKKEAGAGKRPIYNDNNDNDNDSNDNNNNIDNNDKNNNDNNDNDNDIDNNDNYSPATM